MLELANRKYEVEIVTGLRPELQPDFRDRARLRSLSSSQLGITDNISWRVANTLTRSSENCGGQVESSYVLTS
ncbi:hypothetical protein J6590_036368 [Homalodisca vitripennis]|nr:hypothetical protein J6590_036368 [Homalodisca vitripennis]